MYDLVPSRFAMSVDKAFAEDGIDATAAHAWIASQEWKLIKTRFMWYGESIERTFGCVVDAEAASEFYESGCQNY